MIGHAYIAKINRLKWKILANKYQDLELKILIPKVWPAALFKIESGDLSKDNLKNCQFIALNTFYSGNEVLYRFKFFDLFKILKNFKPDLIHVEQGDNAFVYFQIILLCKILSKFLRFKPKFTFFTWVNWKYKKSFKYKFFWQFIENFNLRNSTGAFVGNFDAKSILQDKNFLKSTKVLLQLGVDEEIFKPDYCECNDHKNIIGFIGRFTPEKGIFLLLEAFAKLEKEFQYWQLLFVGDGPEKNNLINFINKLDLQDKVVLINSVTHEKIADIIKNLEILVLPSYDTLDWKEQFGHVLIEAMACKVPVVGSNAGNIAQVIGCAGLIFEQKNILDLTNKLRMLMANPDLREKFGQLGCQRFKENFSYDFIAKETYNFWKKII